MNLPAEIYGVLGFVVVLALIAARVPVAIAMGVVGTVGGALLTDWRITSFMLGSKPFEAMFPYGLSVLPLFVLMGSFAARSGLSSALYMGFHALIGHWRGGLAAATVAACAGFGAICGSSLATAATMGRVALPEMRRLGYDDSLATGSIAAGGTLGILIPPSVVLVIYGLLTEVSIGKLFFAALVPGILGTVLYMAAVAVRIRLNPALAPRAERAGWTRRLRSLRTMSPVCLLFALVMGGIYVGWFSPTEAAAIGAGSTLVFAFIKRSLKVADFFACLRETAETVGMIFLILVGAALFNFFIESSGLPQTLVTAAQSWLQTPHLILVCILVFYLILGCFMDSLSMLLLTVPMLFPLVSELGFDPIWFGVIVVTVVEIGLITPPIGMNLFVILGTAPGLKLPTVIRGVVPFLIADILRLAVLIVFPSLVLWLPERML